MTDIETIRNIIVSYFPWLRPQAERSTLLKTRLTELHDLLTEFSSKLKLDDLEANLLKHLQQLRGIPEARITADALIALKDELETYATVKKQELDDLWNKPKGLTHYMSKHFCLKPEHHTLIDHLHNTRVCANQAVEIINLLIPTNQHTFELPALHSPSPSA